MVKTKIDLIKATLADYPLIENMWRFYVYDMGRYCGFNEAWECPTNLAFVPDDLTNYFTDPTRKAYLVNVGGEIAGFVLLNKVGTKPEVDWNVGEFFIIGKFQGKGIGEQVAVQIFEEFSGVWEVTVTPENRSALSFWRQVIFHYTNGHFLEEIKVVDWARRNPKRVVFYFNSENKLKKLPLAHIRAATITDVSSMVALSDQKRSSYEKAQPRFWRRAQNANEEQTKWFEWLLSKDIHISLVAEVSHQIVGFVIGELKLAPEVYDLGGFTLMIDDFCVESSELWESVGGQLLHTLQQQAKQKGAVQTLVVCGQHDESKRQFLKKQGLNIASEWYVGKVL